ncbi:hypothetical protein [Marinifilum sp. D737]|uniref:hypothetical protein n=1 Tax=Marinifilum sp. D737 TaxID=2969628 RepID=UPI002272307B|nr:hypothetical protein [Marinifilum sp. D737]MCY1635866.1 hypothetical protein [Marinifilum sp. D737]
MKKLLIAILMCVVASYSSFGQNGELMTATHNVYSGITHTYKVTGTDDFKWEVFSDENCTTPVVAAANTYTFSAGTNLTKDLTITWNEPAVSPATYYLRVKQTDAKNCYNYKTLRVVVTSVSTMDFAFVNATSEDCAVNISGSNVSFEVTLTGDYLVHESGKQAQIEYAIGTGAKKWLNVDLAGATTGAGTYTITIPAADLLSADAKVTENFIINVYQLKDGNGAIKDFTSTPVTHTWTATALPTIVDIAF